MTSNLNDRTEIEIPQSNQGASEFIYMWLLLMSCALYFKLEDTAAHNRQANKVTVARPVDTTNSSLVVVEDTANKQVDTANNSKASLVDTAVKAVALGSLVVTVEIGAAEAQVTGVDNLEAMGETGVSRAAMGETGVEVETVVVTEVVVVVEIVAVMVSITSEYWCGQSGDYWGDLGRGEDSVEYGGGPGRNSG